MALGDLYITRAELKTYMSVTISDYDAFIDDVVSSVSREIEDHCHRQFNDAGVVSVRKYKPKSDYLCIVDDFSTTTGLIVESDDNDDGVFESTWVLGTDFELRPVDGIRNGQTGWPYWQIVAIGTQKRFHWARRTNVRVTAQWGWSAVPGPVKMAAKILASDTFQMKDSRMGIAGSDTFGTVIRVRDNVTAAGKLKHYCRQKVFCD